MRDLAIRQWVKSYKKHADTLAFVIRVPSSPRLFSLDSLFHFSKQTGTGSVTASPPALETRGVGRGRRPEGAGDRRRRRARGSPPQAQAMVAEPERAGPGAPPPVHAAHAALDLVGAVALGAVHTTAAVLKAAHRAGGGERSGLG